MMFDRRKNSFNTVNAHLFDCEFNDQEHIIEVQVNGEFSLREAKKQTAYYAEAIGRLPAFLRAEVKTVWLHKGM